MRRLKLNLIMFLILFTCILSFANDNVSIKYSKDGKKILINDSTFSVFVNDSTTLDFKNVKIKNKKIIGFNKFIGQHKIDVRNRKEIFLNKSKNKSFFRLNSGKDNRSGFLLNKLNLDINYNIHSILQASFNTKTGSGACAGIDPKNKYYYVGILQQIIRPKRDKFGLVLAATYSHPLKEWKGERYSFLNCSINNTFKVNPKTFINLNFQYIFEKEYGIQVWYLDGIEYFDYLKTGHHIAGITMGFENEVLKKLSIFTDINATYEIEGPDTTYYYNYWYLNGNSKKHIKNIDTKDIKFNDLQISSGVKFLFTNVQLDIGCTYRHSATYDRSEDEFPLLPILRLHYQFVSKRRN